MADVAIIFHWPPSDMGGMDLSELMSWRAQAARRSQAPEKGKR